METKIELRQLALDIVLASDLTQKVKMASTIGQSQQLDANRDFACQLDQPGRADLPRLVAPALVQRRNMATAEGRAIMVHALAHIEMNAINLAADIMWRFPGMPERFYNDWARVCREEAYHFGLLQQHLEGLGYRYGDFAAHDSLWEMAFKTRHDLLARLALVPRTMEARGLDASPGLIAKMKQVQDLQIVGILEIIFRDEITHVAIGNFWFNYLCQQQDLSPIETYRQLAQQYRAPVLRGPFNLPARKLAGFSDEELQSLQELAASR